MQNPIDIVNLRAGVDMGRFSFFLFGLNMLDGKYYTDHNPSDFVGLPCDIGFPRRARDLRGEGAHPF